VTATTQPQPTRRNRIVGHLFGVSQILIPGAYAWAVSVVPAATSVTAGSWSRITALLAFSCLVFGTFLHKERPRLGYALGIWGLLACSTITWLANAEAIRVDRLDPLRAAAASIGWLLFSLGWGTPWRSGMHPEDNPRAQLHPRLEPRRPATIRTPLIVATGAAGAFACLLLAWRATEPDRALMMHGVALGCAVSIVSTSASLALAQGRRRTELPSRQRIAFALPWFLALVALVVIALAWLLAR